MLQRAGVEVRLRTRADRATLVNGEFQSVVIATGSYPRMDGYTSLRPGAEGIEGADADNVHSVWDVFDRIGEFTGPVVIVEDDPHLAGTAAAEFLAGHGHSVTIVTPHMHAAADLPVHHAPQLYRRLAALGVAVKTGTFVTAITPRALACEDRFGGDRFQIAHAGPVVLAMGNTAANELARDLEGTGPEIHLVGDALAPRQVDTAILDGERAGWMIGTGGKNGTA